MPVAAAFPETRMGALWSTMVADASTATARGTASLHDAFGIRPSLENKLTTLNFLALSQDLLLQNELRLVKGLLLGYSPRASLL